MRLVALSALLLGALIIQTQAHAATPPVQRQNLDAHRSTFTFRVGKFYGDAVAGEFTKAEGFLMRNARGERMVVIDLDADGIDVAESRMLTRIAKSDSFFGAAKFPNILFESDWHDPDVLVSGGSVQGNVTIRGIKRLETFRITPAKCSRPGIDCDVEAKGSVNRRAYGIGSMSHVLAPEVELTLKVRFKPTGS